MFMRRRSRSVRVRRIRAAGVGRRCFVIVRVAVVMVNIDTTHVSWARLEVAAAKALCSG